jgi:starch phosphorylase
VVQSTPELAEAVHLIESGHFSNGDVDLFRPLLDNLTGSDPFFVMADFADYLRAQDAVSQAWSDRTHWNRMSVLNSARSGFFSSDRSIREYCDQIWKVDPLKVDITCDAR